MHAGGAMRGGGFAADKRHSDDAYTKRPQTKLTAC